MLSAKIGYFRPRGFTPLSIAGLGMWWDASVASSVTLNGSTVSQWSDLSGNGRHLLQPTASLQPTYTINARNGLNALTMGASGTDMHTSTSAATQLFSVTSQSIFWALISPTAQNVQARVYTQIVTGQTNDFSGTNFMIPPYLPALTQCSVFAAGATRNTVNFTAGTPLVMSFVHNGTTASNRLNRGTAATSNFTLNTSIGMARIGSGANTTRGTLCEVIVYNNVALGEADRTAVERYLASKWAITVA